MKHGTKYRKRRQRERKNRKERIARLAAEERRWHELLKLREDRRRDEWFADPRNQLILRLIRVLKKKLNEDPLYQVMMAVKVLRRYSNV